MSWSFEHFAVLMQHFWGELSQIRFGQSRILSTKADTGFLSCLDVIDFPTTLFYRAGIGTVALIFFLRCS